MRQGKYDSCDSKGQYIVVPEIQPPGCARLILGSRIQFGRIAAGPDRFLERLWNPADKSCSQSGRQSVRHSPRHLNSSSVPPMLPPQSGHTQFRMLDMTSEPTITCISTSMNDKEASTACPPASDRAHLAV